MALSVQCYDQGLASRHKKGGREERTDFTCFVQGRTCAMSLAYKPRIMVGSGQLCLVNS